MNAKDELQFKLEYYENLSKGPADHLPESKKSFIYRNKGWHYLTLFSYKIALGEKRDNLLNNAIDMGNLASEIFEEDMLLNLEVIFIAKSLLSEDLTYLAKQILSLAKNNKNESVNPLFTVASCILLKHDHTPYMDLLKKRENKKYTSILPGTTQAIDYLISQYERNLIDTVNDMLSAHHKEAGNRHSNIYNTSYSF